MATTQHTLSELTAEAEHTARRVSLYQQRLYAGRWDQRRLAELEREAAGAAARLRSARAAPTTVAADGERRQPDLAAAMRDVSARLRAPGLTNPDRMVLLQRQAEFGDLRDALELRARRAGRAG
jgi:hypothetical protein